MFTQLGTTTVRFLTKLFRLLTSQRQRAFLFRRQKGGHVHFEGFRQYHQLRISYTTKLCLNFRESGAAQFQSKHGTPGREHLLGHLFLITQFSDLRTNQIFRLPLLSSCHAPKMELDTIMERLPNCSNIRAKCRVLTNALNKLKTHQFGCKCERMRACGTY